MYLFLRDFQNIYGIGTISKSIIFGKKVQCSLFDQKWLILGPSGQKSIFFKKSRSSFDQFKNLNHIIPKKL